MNMTWQQTLEKKHALEKAIKARSMIYQVQAKEEAALAFGKPIDFYYHLPYPEWEKVSRELVIKREKVFEECRQLGIPYNMPYSDFQHYRERMGLNRLVNFN